MVVKKSSTAGLASYRQLFSSTAPENEFLEKIEETTAVKQQNLIITKTRIISNSKLVEKDEQ
ncbi:MAG: hypothetical protein ACTSXO_11390 [Candidatus Heimdallarchaeota archaeon]